MIFSKYNEDEIRGVCRQSMETLEYWLRQIVEEKMAEEFGNNYLDIKDNGGGFILSQKRTKEIKTRQSNEQQRFARIIDAAFLDDLISIICHPHIYNNLFNPIFSKSFSNGAGELRNMLNKLIEPRNRLSHANPITNRQAEQIICYSHDIIDSIKEYYNTNNLHMEFNVPRIVRFKDSFGNEIHFNKSASGKGSANFMNVKESYLRPGDILEIEVDIDESFKKNEYSITWRAIKPIPNFGNVKKISLTIEEKHIGESFNLQCVLVSNKSWHRMQQGYDDLLLIYYKVLPNI